MKTTKWSVLALLAGGVGCGLPEGEAPERTELGAQQAEIARGTAVPDGTYPWAVSLHTSSATSTANRTGPAGSSPSGWTWR